MGARRVEVETTMSELTDIRVNGKMLPDFLGKRVRVVVKVLRVRSSVAI